MKHDPCKGHRALRRGRVSLPGQIYNVTATTLGRQPHFSHFDAARAASACFENRVFLGDAHMLAWVLMPDHAHWLVQLGQVRSLESIVRSLKAAAARAANAAMGREGPLWARGYHDHALRREEDVATLARHIIANPVRAGIVERVGAYPFWNAEWIGAR